MNINSKIWIEKDGKKILGKGPVQLLLRIEELGSLRQAAFALDMSYTKAWKLIMTLEAALETPLLEKRIGGGGGGSSSLTPEAKALVAEYALMEAEIAQALQLIFEKHFVNFK